MAMTMQTAACTDKTIQQWMDGAATKAMTVMAKETTE